LTAKQASIGIVRKLKGEQAVKNHAQTKNVAGATSPALADLFRRQIALHDALTSNGKPIAHREIKQLGGT